MWSMDFTMDSTISLTSGVKPQPLANTANHLIQSYNISSTVQT